MNPLRRWVLGIVRQEMGRVDAANMAYIRSLPAPRRYYSEGDARPIGMKR